MHQYKVVYTVKEGVHIYLERFSYLKVQSIKNDLTIPFHMDIGKDLIELSLNTPKLLKYYLKVMLFNTMIQLDSLDYFNESEADKWALATIKNSSNILFNISDADTPIEIPFKYLENVKSDFGCTAILYNDYISNIQRINKQTYKLLCKYSFYEETKNVYLTKDETKMINEIIAGNDKNIEVNISNVIVKALLSVHTGFISKTPIENYKAYLRDYYNSMWR